MIKPVRAVPLFREDGDGSPPVVTDFYKTSGVRGDLSYFDPSLTRQEFAEECDINTIMAKYEASGAISHVNRHEPMYLDTTMYPELQGALDVFAQAQREFNGLPASVRKEFDNDPQKFVDFASDPENIERMRECRLAPPAPVEPAPIKVEVANLNNLGSEPEAPLAPLAKPETPSKAPRK